MAIKKSQLYSALWEACNALRGGMDASQYKDYVLVVLFLKYISDKAKSDPDMLITVPDGCSFYDVAEHKNKPTINEKMNTVLEAIAKENDLGGVINTVDFHDENKLGKGADMIKTVTELIKVFENENLDFSNNRAADDDLIGDAYEYLMRQFASQSGKSKGQFYTPAEVSRVMANIVGINKDNRNQNISIYDPTCGSGSLLLRAKAEALTDNVSLDGQEKDLATIGMARMSMIIHGVEGAELKHGDTLNSPMHTDRNETQLKQFDYIVANPPFSVKKWMKTAMEDDQYRRWGSSDGLPPVPPNGCGDYAFLLHIIASLKPDGKAACILPHGVLFRGNEEAKIREWLIRRHYISGIIGLPANLFYGTGIPACIIIIDKKNAMDAKGIFMIDAKDGYAKDGNKNRLREMDIRRIIDAWEKHEDIPHFARFVPFEEIHSEKNNFNLNIPRYIAPEDKEVLQDITAHIHGNIPAHDVEQTLAHYWNSCPSLLSELFTKLPDGYYALTAQDPADIRSIIEDNADYKHHISQYQESLQEFFNRVKPEMKALTPGFNPKQMVKSWGDAILSEAQKQKLVNAYDVYEILLNYWAETMQDDCYLISRDGWSITTSLAPKKKTTYLDILCDLVPVEVMLKEYFVQEHAAIQTKEAEIEQIQSEMTELQEEYPDELDGTDTAIANRLSIAMQRKPMKDEDQVLANYLYLLTFKEKEAKAQLERYVKLNKEYFDQFEKLNKSTVNKRLKVVYEYEYLDEDVIAILQKYVYYTNRLAQLKNELKTLQTVLFESLTEKYSQLSADDICHLVVDSKWESLLSSRANSLLTTVSQKVTTDIIALRDRYEQTLPQLDERVAQLRAKVNANLAAMGIKL